ncbi:MAG: hypothetical protein V3T08_01360 [Gemmatimonadota bacterium]
MTHLGRAVRAVVKPGAFLIVTYLTLGLPARGYGQDSLDPDLTCQQAPAQLNGLCRDVIVGLQVFQAEAGLLLVGGNPVLGTASPIGTRFRFIPRLYLGARINFVFVDVPNIIEPGSGGTLSFPAAMPQLDVSVGLFNGFSPGPTLGGLLAVELLGSLSAVILPGGEGFQRNATGFGIGARLGLVRESFTAPGISISGMYKWTNRVEFGDVSAGDAAQFSSDLKVLSLRGGISKSFLFLGLAGGLGWDRYMSDVAFALRGPSGEKIEILPESDRTGLTTERWSAFVDLSYILLFFNIVGELGWQETGKFEIPSTIDSTREEIESGNLFGAIGIRLSL